MGTQFPTKSLIGPRGNLSSSETRAITIRLESPSWNPPLPRGISVERAVQLPSFLAGVMAAICWVSITSLLMVARMFRCFVRR